MIIKPDPNRKPAEPPSDPYAMFAPGAMMGTPTDSGGGGAVPPPEPPMGSVPSEPEPGGEDSNHDGGPNGEYIYLHLEQILERGPLIRCYMDERSLKRFAEDLAVQGDLDHAITVREEEIDGEIVYLLVTGRRRLRAAKRAKLEKVRVRNRGRITVAEALALQVRENDQRENPHVVDTAVGYAMLVAEGSCTQADIVRMTGKKPSYVSYMRATGEAILLLDETQREKLYHHPEATVSYFQEIAAVHPVADRAERLRSMIAVAESAPAKEEEAMGNAKPSPAPRHPRKPSGGPTRRRDGYGFRYTVSDERLRSDPDGAVEDARDFCNEQIEALIKRADELRQEDSSSDDALEEEVELDQSSTE